MLEKAPAFQFYAKDWLSDDNVRLMTPEERGDLFDKIIKGCVKEDMGYLDQFSFIGKIKRAAKGRNPIPVHIREKVLLVGKCLKCGAVENLSIDHIKPYSQGGSDKLSNLQCLCRLCNSRKGTKVNREWLNAMV